MFRIDTYRGTLKLDGILSKGVKMCIFSYLYGSMIASCVRCFFCVSYLCSRVKINVLRVMFIDGCRFGMLRLTAHVLIYRITETNIRRCIFFSSICSNDFV